MTSLSEKLRPTAIDDLIQPFHVIQALRAMVERKDILNLTLYGPSGTGKSSLARILLPHSDYHVLELNGSLTTGIDVVRDGIEPFSSTTSLLDKPKAVFIDEAENLSKSAQASLRGIIERYDDIRYILAVNDISGIDLALQSRCLPVSFGIPFGGVASTIDRILPRYQAKLIALGYTIDHRRLETLFRRWFPDMRGLANEIQFLK